MNHTLQHLLGIEAINGCQIEGTVILSLKCNAERGLRLCQYDRKPLANELFQFGMTTPMSAIEREIDDKKIMEVINGSVGYNVPEAVMGGLICYGYGAGRTTGNSTLSEPPEAVDTCASIFDDRADLLNPEE